MDSDYDYRYEETTHQMIENCSYCGEHILECDDYAEVDNEFFHLECLEKLDGCKHEI